MRLGFGVLRGDRRLAISDLGGAAVAVIDRDDLLDVVQLDCGREVVPERLVPILERLSDDADCGAGDHELAEFASQVAFRHVLSYRLLHARINAAENHGLVVSGCRECRERLQCRKRRKAAGCAQQIAPVKPARQQIAAAGAASETVNLSHVSSRWMNCGRNVRHFSQKGSRSPDRSPESVRALKLLPPGVLV